MARIERPYYPIIYVRGYAMTKDEIQAFRDTGYFNDTARQKGLQFIDQCKLKRPF